MRLLGSSRLDEDGNMISTEITKRENNYVFSQMHGGYKNFNHDVVTLTNQEFNSLFSVVWVVCKMQDWENTEYHGIFLSPESAEKKLREIIKERFYLTELTFNYSNSFVNGVLLESIEYNYGDYTFSAYQMVIKP